MSSGDPSAPPEDQSWGGWLSSMANNAYETVAGSDSVPENFEDLSQGTALTRDSSASANAFSSVDSSSRQALYKQLVSLIGMDVMNMRLSLPIWLFEPSTALTRMAEMFEYSELLDRAATEKDPVLRDALVAAFLISAFAHTERTRKPFNPLLGETFAYEDAGAGLKFVAEQVSHHPPISASVCHGRGWTAGESVDIKATYNGNSVEISNSGPQAARYLHLTESDTRYSWNLANAVVTNLFIGGTFVDHYGTIELKNESTGCSSVLSLTQCGWFSAGRYEVSGTQLSKEGDPLGTYTGHWNKQLDFERTTKLKGEGSIRLWVAGKHLLSEEDGGGPTGKFPSFTRFGAKLHGMDDEMKLLLPPTDSRLRPDRLALELKNSVLASEEKNRVEQAQRDRLGTDGEKTHRPRWFKRADESASAIWEPSDDYWAFVSSMTENDRKEMALW